jgi:transcriptional regulator with XRE-family HTH domain
MDLFAYVGNRIRDLRTGFGGGNGISQDALAKKLDVAPNTISRWETATYHPSLEDLDKLARFFGTSILDFFPPSEAPSDQRITALLRSAEQLAPEDLEELQRYAEYRRARSLYGPGGRPQPGRKRRQTK